MGSILPTAKVQFIDQNGRPLAGGRVFFYQPNTEVKQDTWQDSELSVPNANPVVLDGRGQASIWGRGAYRQVVFDANGNQIWDQITQDSNASLIGNLVDAIYTAGDGTGDTFIPGTTTSLTLPADPGSLANTWIAFDGTIQDSTQVESLDGTTLTFTDPIPQGVSVVMVKLGQTISIGVPGSGSVSDKAVAANAGIGSSKLSFLQLGAGALRRTVEQKLRDSMSVKDFGAVGDGTTDDTLAFQRAIAGAAARNGAVIFVPAGQYKITSKLTLQNGVSLQGESGAAAFPELNNLAVARLIWQGANNGTMCDTVEKWAGNLSNIVFDANGIAATCWAPLSIGGCLISNVQWINSTAVGVNWTTTSGNPSGLNTFVNCMSDQHAALGFRMAGLIDAAVTLNTFLGCRFSGAVQNLILYEFADTNMFIGGRIEGGTQYGIVINDVAGGLNVDSILFSCVTMDGPNIPGLSFCFIGPPVSPLPPGGGSTVATFRDCHMTGSSFLNTAAGNANIKVIDCPAFAMMYGSTGNYVPAQDIATGPSPFTYTNHDPYAQNVVLSGGVITTLKFVRNGVAEDLGLPSGSFILNPGDGLEVTFTTPPAVFTRWQI